MRFSLLTVLLLCGALSASAQDTSLTAVEEAFEQANVSRKRFASVVDFLTSAADCQYSSHHV